MHTLPELPLKEADKTGEGEERTTCRALFPVLTPPVLKKCNTEGRSGKVTKKSGKSKEIVKGRRKTGPSECRKFAFKIVQIAQNRRRSFFEKERGKYLKQTF